MCGDSCCLTSKTAMNFKKKDRKSLVWRMKVMASNLVQGQKLASRRQLLNKLLHGASPRNPTYVLGRILSDFKSQGGSELTVYKEEEVFILFEVNDWAFVTVFNSVRRKGYVPLDFCDVVRDFYEYDSSDNQRKESFSKLSHTASHSQSRRPLTNNERKHVHIPHSNTAPDLAKSQHEHLPNSHSISDFRAETETATRRCSSTPTSESHHHRQCCCCHHIHHLKIEERHMNILEYLSRTHAVRPEDCESGLGDSESIHSHELFTTHSKPYTQNEHHPRTDNSKSQLVRRSSMPKTELLTQSTVLSSGPPSTTCSSHESSDELESQGLKLEHYNGKQAQHHQKQNGFNSRNSSLSDSAIESVKLSPTQFLNQLVDIHSPGMHHYNGPNHFLEPHHNDINTHSHPKVDNPKKLPRISLHRSSPSNRHNETLKSDQPNQRNGLIRARKVDLGQIKPPQSEPSQTTQKHQSSRVYMLSELHTSSGGDSHSEDELSVQRQLSRVGFDQSSTSSRELLERSQPESVCDLDDEGTTCWELDDSDGFESDNSFQPQKNKITHFALPPKRSSLPILNTKPSITCRTECTHPSTKIQEKLSPEKEDAREKRGFMKAMYIDTVDEEDEFSDSEYPESESAYVDRTGNSNQVSSGTETEISDQPPSETETGNEIDPGCQSETESITSEMSIVKRHNERQQTLKSIQERYKQLEQARKLSIALKEIERQIKTSN